METFWSHKTSDKFGFEVKSLLNRELGLALQMLIVLTIHL